MSITAQKTQKDKQSQPASPEKSEKKIGFAAQSSSSEAFETSDDAPEEAPSAIQDKKEVAGGVKEAKKEPQGRVAAKKSTVAEIKKDQPAGAQKEEVTKVAAPTKAKSQEAKQAKEVEVSKKEPSKAPKE